MQIGNRLDEAEPETSAGCGPALVHAIEPLEDLVALMDGDTGTVVGDDGDDGRPNEVSADRDPRPGGRVPNRVLYEVSEQLRQQFPIPEDGCARGFLLDRQQLTVVGRHVEVDFGDVTRDLVEIEGSETGLARAGLDLSDAQESLESLVDVADFGLRLLDLRYVSRTGLRRR